MNRKALGLVGVALMLGLSACSGGDDSIGEVDTTSAPQDAQWSSLNGIYVPHTPACGQSTGDGGVRVGYEQTPQCGVVAAMNGQTALATAKDQEWPGVANTVLAPGKGKDQWVQARSMQSITKPVSDPAKFVGFKISSYSPETMQVLLAVKWPDGEMTAQVSQLDWQGNTWRLVLPTQDKAPDAVKINNLDGFTSFGAK